MSSKHPSIIHKAMHDAEKRKKQQGNAAMYIILVLLVASLASALVMATTDTSPYKIPITQLTKKITKKVTNVFKSEVGEFVAFESAEEFKAYLEDANNNDSMYYGSVRTFAQPAVMEDSAETWSIDPDFDNINLGTDKATGGSDGSPGRVSETNVQVVGIDEPDIVKTDGNNIYFSNNFNNYYYAEPSIDWGSDVEYVRRTPQQAVQIIGAWPPADMELKAAIEESGNLLLQDDILVIFANRYIYGYDVSDQAKPEKLWTIKYDDKTYLQAARLYNDEIYLITRNYVNYGSPCPYKPITFGETELSIACTDIYHPIAPVSVDSTFTAMKVDIKSGDVTADVSFVGSTANSVIYMSTNSLYTTYNHGIDMFAFMSDFLVSEMSDLIPQDLLARIEKLQNYDLASRTKMVELETVMEQWYNSLDRDDSLKIENETENRMQDYYQEHFRDLYKTEIVKIDLEDFKISADGIVPGYPLNQFSLDEYEDHLRIATTIGDRWFGGFGSQDTANDIYVLDEDLSITGAITDLGLTERIYSARFIEDKGYLVTFRQTDPFYVLDLSDPDNPQKTGELKIPGYSSYLHPLRENIILGVGKEGSNVKLSVFDVSDPKDPQEVDKYTLDEYYSEAVDNHHAFLLDSKHEIFFLPGGKGGYVFSYEDDELELLKAVGEYSVKRALYLDDYLYVIANESITVLDQKNWVEVKKFDILPQ